jgi:Spermidine/putrescine-binding periplasmic protein
VPSLHACRSTLEDPPPAASPPSSGDNILHVYTWSAYIDEDLLKGFEQKTGIKVIADIYDSNETMLARMQAGGGNQYSIVYPGTELEFVIMVIAVSCVKLLSAHNSTQHTSRKHKV